MTCRWIDSCAAYASITDVGTAGYTITSAPAYITTAGRWGTGALRATNTAHFVDVVFGTGLSTWIFGFVLQSSGTNGVNPFFRLAEGTTTHVDLRMNASQILTATRNGTLLGTGSTAINPATNYLVAGKVVIHDSAGSVEVWVNGVQEINVSGIDTRNGGTGVVDRFRMTQLAGNTDFSELYIFDAAGAKNNTLVTDWRIYPRRGSAAGNYAQWTPLASTNVSNIDDTQGNDGDTSYNASSTAGQIDTFQFDAVPWTSGTIRAIMHRIVARKDDAGARTIRPKQRQSSTDYSGTTVPVTTAYAHYREIVETNPDTTADYTTAEMRATNPEFGYELVA